MGDPERAEVPIRRAVPIKGPGIPEPQAKEVQDTDDTIGKYRHIQATQPAVKAAPDRRHELVDLNTVLAMLELVRPQEREHMKCMLKLLRELSPGARLRVLRVINGIFT